MFVFALAAFLELQASPDQTSTSPPQAEPQAQPWDAGTRYPDWHAPSTLEIRNECNHTHSFSITKQNADFLDFQFQQPVVVPGHSSKEVAVLFHTNGMAKGDYTGLVTIICLDCKETPPCMQDRKTVAPHVRVIIPPPREPPPPPSNPEEQPQSEEPPCNGTDQNCDQIRAELKTIGDKLSKLDAVVAQAKVAYEKARKDFVAAETARTKAFRDFYDSPNWTPSTPMPPSLAQLDQTYQAATHAYYVAEKAFDETAQEADSLQSSYEFLEGLLSECVERMTICLQQKPPQQCTPDKPCTDGWTQPPPTNPGATEKCTQDHPCTTGAAYIGPPVVTAATDCWKYLQDCDQLRLAVDRAQAEAEAAQRTANAAAAEAQRASAAYQQAQAQGPKPQDVTALYNTSYYSAIVAKRAQQLADDAKKRASEAFKAYQDCLAHAKLICPTVPPAVVINTSAANPGTASRPPCPPAGDCDKLRQAWQDAERDAAVAQLLADEEKQKQQQNEAEAAYHEHSAQTDENFANGQTQHARELLDLAGQAAANAQRDRQIAAAATTEAERAQWNKAAEEDTNDKLKYVQDAEQDEQNEVEYHMRAAAESAIAAQLRRAAGDAQARADAAKAAAAAAKKAYDDCLAALKKAQAECTRKGLPATVSSPPRSATGSTTGTSTVSPPPPPGTAGIPDVAHRVIDHIQLMAQDYKICEWRTILVPPSIILEDVFARGVDRPETSDVEVRKGGKDDNGFSIIELHCTGDANVIISFTYRQGTVERLHRMVLSCGP